MGTHDSIVSTAKILGQASFDLGHSVSYRPMALERPLLREQRANGNHLERAAQRVQPLLSDVPQKRIRSGPQPNIEMSANP